MEGQLAKVFSRGWRVMCGLVGALGFYALFVTYVAVAEPRELPLEDAMIWAGIWGVALGVCIVLGMRLCADWLAGKPLKREFSWVTRKWMSVSLIVGSVGFTWYMLCTITGEEEMLSSGWNWVLLGIAISTISIAMRKMRQEGRMRQ